MGCTISSSSALSGCLCRATLFEMPSPIDLISIPARSLRGLPVGLIDADRLRHEPVGSRNQLTLATRAVQVPSLKAGGLVRSMLCVTLCAVVVQLSKHESGHELAARRYLYRKYLCSRIIVFRGRHKGVCKGSSISKVLHLLAFSQEHGGSVIIARRRYL